MKAFTRARFTEQHSACDKNDIMFTAAMSVSLLRVLCRRFKRHACNELQDQLDLPFKMSKAKIKYENHDSLRHKFTQHINAPVTYKTVRVFISASILLLPFCQLTQRTICSYLFAFEAYRFTFGNCSPNSSRISLPLAA